MVSIKHKRITYAPPAYIRVYTFSNFHFKLILETMHPLYDAKSAYENSLLSLPCLDEDLLILPEKLEHKLFLYFELFIQNANNIRLLFRPIAVKNKTIRKIVGFSF